MRGSPRHSKKGDRISESDQDPGGMGADIEIFKALLAEGKQESAIDLSLEILSKSRSAEGRNHEIEAWIRMERALLGAIPEDDIGKELRWCVDRLAALSQGSPLHGLALLNLGVWHRNNSERMMALVSLSEISTSSSHPNDIVGLARLESGRILSEMGDNEPAMRHLWVAMKRLSESNLSGEALVCGLEWLDLALNDVESDSPSMDSRIADARPRENPGNSSASSNPDDIRMVVESLMPALMADLSGKSRNDLGLILDAGEILGDNDWRDLMIQRTEEIQDPRILEVLQS
ncbi:MAG: hypothetical protein VX954_04525 [Candidatus Thermoplasmatota archaeon]|nr:hypothetical protein [Candidatus Thermoplasmatota archaeon]